MVAEGGVGLLQLDLLLLELLVEPPGRCHLIGQLLVQAPDHRAGQDQESAPHRDVGVEVDRPSAHLEPLREHHDEDSDQQHAEHRPQHRAAPAEVVAGKDDRQEVEVEERELERHDVVRGDSDDERHQNEQLLEVADQVRLQAVHVGGPPKQTTQVTFQHGGARRRARLRAARGRPRSDRREHR